MNKLDHRDDRCSCEAIVLLSLRRAYSSVYAQLRRWHSEKDFHFESRDLLLLRVHRELPPGWLEADQARPQPIRSRSMRSATQRDWDLSQKAFLHLLERVFDSVQTRWCDWLRHST